MEIHMTPYYQEKEQHRVIPLPCPCTHVALCHYSLANSLRNIKNSLDDELFQILYADDAGGGGTLAIIEKWWSKVKEK